MERTSDGDHYDPEHQCVRLTDDEFDSRTLTAITVATRVGSFLLFSAQRPIRFAQADEEIHVESVGRV